MNLLKKAGLLLLCLAASPVVAQHVFETDSARRADEKYMAEHLDRFGNYNKIRPMELPDSVELDFPDLEAKVILQLRNARFWKYREFASWQERLQKHLRTIPFAIADSTIPHRIVIREGYDNSLKNQVTVTENTGAKTTMVTQVGKVIELLPAGWEVEITDMPIHRITIYARTYEQLKKLSTINIDPLVEAIVAQIDTTRPRPGIRGRAVLENDKVTDCFIYHPVMVDYLEANAGAGINFINNSVVPEFNGSFSLLFRNRFNVSKHKITLMSNYMMFTEKNDDGSTKAYLKGGISLSYNRNLTKSNENPVYFGLGAGILDNRSQGSFGGKAWKFFINTTFDRFTISPEFYWINGYKDFRGGLSLRYNF